MSWMKAALLASFLSHWLIAGAPEAVAKDRNCRRGEHIQIQDIDMSPDPVREGQRIRSWKVRIRFDGRGACETDIFVREGSHIVGHARNYKLRTGVNEIEIPARDNFRFRGRESCLNVQVDLDGSRHQIDADRRFCATQRMMWSMREPEDHRAQR